MQIALLQVRYSLPLAGRPLLALRIADAAGSDSTEPARCAVLATTLGSSAGKNEYWTPSHLMAGETLTLQSGGDTTFKGASGKANQIKTSVGGDLLPFCFN